AEYPNDVNLTVYWDP
nr:RecName: Full=32 kDa cell wall protein [Daucus carota]